MVQDGVMTTEERSILFHQREEQRRRDKQARDEAGMQTGYCGFRGGVSRCISTLTRPALHQYTHI
jgi:hypothetical protein